MFNGGLLRKLRAKKQLNPTALTFELDKIGLRISRPTIISWEEGTTEPRVSEAIKISEYFNVPIKEFCKS
jgi:DNA-binding XRE family transcriptional regulator